MATTTNAPAADRLRLDRRVSRYLSGLARHALRVLVAVLIVPLIMLKAAHSYSKADAATAADPAASASLKAAMAGGGILSMGGLTANDVAMIGGLVIGIGGLLMQWHFQRKRDRREEAEHEAQMREHEARMQELRE